MRFVDRSRAHAIGWKARTMTLTDGARMPADYVGEGGRTIRGPFDYCLPPEHATLNLLPAARQAGLDAFAELGIPWHHGVGSGPGNHLLASQVQCVNALAPLLHDPDRVKAAFSAALPIERVLPVEHGWYVTFEWIGERDHLGESHGRARTRGARATSADALLRYRSLDGRTEVALIEWKLVEDYRGKTLSGGAAGRATRMRNHRAAWEADACPLRHDAIGYDDLFVDPLYQLFRLQLLAAAMEQTGELDADVVRVVLVLPAANDALAPHAQRWATLLHIPDRFTVLDSSQFTDSRLDLVEGDYVDRYAMAAPDSAA